MSIEKWALLIACCSMTFDAFIAIWLVFTWFWAGEHKRCEVNVTCAVCGTTASHKCAADPRNKEPQETKA